MAAISAVEDITPQLVATGIANAIRHGAGTELRNRYEPRSLRFHPFTTKASIFCASTAFGVF